jgi:RNA polymerase sigma-70 factor (ECF subfamily)
MGVHKSSETSATLLQRVAEFPPDQAAWRRFNDRYGPRILRWCFGRGLQDADARDVTQIVLAKLVVRLRSFVYDPQKSFRGFLRKVVNNALDDMLRADGSPARARMIKTLSDPEARESLIAGVEHEFDLELLELARESVQRRVEPHTWKAYELTAEQGLRGAEAATRLGMTPSATYEAKNRVKKMLQEEISRRENTTPGGKGSMPH